MPAKVILLVLMIALVSWAIANLIVWANDRLNRSEPPPEVDVDDDLTSPWGRP